MALYWVFAGSYTPADREGIHLLKFDSETGRLERAGGMDGVENPTFLAADARNRRLYSVSETSNGAVVSIAVDYAAGNLKELSRQPTKGGSPCHLRIDGTGERLFTVNYMSGSVCLYSVGKLGDIRSMSDFIQHEGHSIREDRQEAPHPHSINAFPGTPADCWLVPDLGTDRIYTYRHDRGNGKLEAIGFTTTEPGSGPRHLAFHPSMLVLYVIHELSSAISAYHYDPADGSISLFQQISTLPSGYTGENTCADIHLSTDGRFLYGSNRGHDSLCVFRVGQQGELMSLGTVPTLGRTPRNFAVIPADGGDYLLVGNQDSDQIVVMKAKDGIPAPTGITYELHKPACVIPVAAEELNA